jgi:1,4-alpha-glucan branching enzyme
MEWRTQRATLLWAAVLAVGLAGCAARSAAVPQATPGGVRFVFFHSSARSVALVGSFNQWSTTSHALARSGGRGSWSIVTPLPPGEHTFMFVVDGRQWVSPPAAEDYVDDGFGARNGVVVVRPSER